MEVNELERAHGDLLRLLKKSNRAHAALVHVIATRVGTHAAESFASDAVLIQVRKETSQGTPHATDHLTLWANDVAARQRGEG